MSHEEPTPLSRCHNCGFEAPARNDEWGSTDHPPFGTLTSCPECGSTDVHGRD